MKRLMLVVCVVMLAGNVWADCIKYEYAELKDMSQKELETAFTENMATDLELTKHGVTNNCLNQAQLISRVLMKRFPDNAIFINPSKNQQLSDTAPSK